LDDADQPLEQVFPVGEHAALWVVNYRGTVRVSGWERPEVRVVAQKRGEDAFGRPDGRWVRGLEADQTGALCRLRTVAASLPGVAGSLPRAMDLEVRVPRQSAVVVQSPNGLVVVEDLAGVVFVRSQSGPVSLRRVAGTILVLGESGSCTGQWLRGEMALRLGGGSLRLEESALSLLEAETATGNLEIQVVLAPTGSYILRSRSGSLTLALPPPSDATLDLRTESGRIECLVPGERLFADFGRLMVRMGGGNAAVELYTSSGDLRVEPWKWEGELPAPPLPMGTFPALPDDTPEEFTLLRELVQGRMTAAEGLHRLADMPPAW